MWKALYGSVLGHGPRALLMLEVWVDYKEVKARVDDEEAENVGLLFTNSVGLKRGRSRSLSSLQPVRRSTQA